MSSMISADKIKKETSALYALDDLRIVSRPLLDTGKFTLCAVLRNELYFLPAFLSHYRKLGIERFIFLDDHSDDGTRELLLEQPDVMVLESGHRYGDQVDLPEPLGARIANRRILYIWRALLLDKFCKNQWALQVDLDEFVHLPDTARFQDLVPRLDDEGALSVWGVMLDMYPRDLADLAAEKDSDTLNPDADWYFDGQRHLQLNSNTTPRTLYPGARARLFQNFGISKHYHEYGFGTEHSYLTRLRKTRFGTKVLSYNCIHKPILTKWQDGSLFLNSHETTLPTSRRVLLPMQHFRFTGSLYSRVERALRERSYSGQSRDYVFLSMLLEKMGEGGHSFLYRHSRRFEGFKDFEATRNTKGF
ncbi:glycosyltransferase family 2 protein [Nitratireductor sp. XY-223]|uniref:glycosyltransferase family 2 protein n=1 Tax=Nitratireductor sp. XY-223 TaxID=2561926 RepID=UPI0010A9AD53|nr:glycosyltransferase family 2 protein [Nitratireductor sp. XY-223]